MAFLPFNFKSRISPLLRNLRCSSGTSSDLKLLGRQFVTVGRRQPTKIIEDHCTKNFISASQMVRKVAALSNLVCRILIHPTSLPSYVIGLASLLLAGRAPRTKFFLDPSAEHQPPWKT